MHEHTYELTPPSPLHLFVYDGELGCLPSLLFYNQQIVVAVKKVEHGRI